MMDLEVTLDFACCGCDDFLNVTVRCTSKGPTPVSVRSVAMVNIPCPMCGQVNQLLFEPGGTIRCVRPYRRFRQIPEPSIN
jgi:hypothetical protein